MKHHKYDKEAQQLNVEVRLTTSRNLWLEAIGCTVIGALCGLLFAAFFGLL